MPLRAVEATQEGIRAIEAYDGENADLPFIQAVLLTRVQEICPTIEIYKFLNQEYPLTLAEGAITNAILGLERKNYVKVYREIDFSTHITVETGNYSIPTTLGEFVNANLAKGYSIPATQICDDLCWHGESLRMADCTLRLRSGRK